VDGNNLRDVFAVTGKVYSTEFYRPNLLSFYYVAEEAQFPQTGMAFFDAPDFLSYTYFVSEFSNNLRRL
jgi:DNA-binding beta-propeller fold protein YncE